jgi:predicted RNA-binding protein YlqC (UPF0109 family)
VSVEDELNDEYDEGLDDEELDDEANLVDGAARAQAVTDFLARELVEDVEAIDVTASESRGETTLLIHASPQDLGRLIGRRGRVIQAVRQVARAAGAADGARINVEVAE